VRSHLPRWATIGVVGAAFSLLHCVTEPPGPRSGEPAGPRPGDRQPPAVMIESPIDGAVVKGIVPVTVEVFDDAPIDSVWIEIRTGSDERIHDVGFGTPPYAFSWDTRFLPQAAYHICASARDSVGNRAAFACNTVRAYPRVILRYDDGTVESWRGATAFTWQIAALFHNPYDVAVQVDTVMVYVHQNAALGAPFRFVLWNVTNGRPSTEAEGTPDLRVRNPRNTLGYWPMWNTVIPPGGAIAAGWQQTDLETTAIGEDLTGAFQDGSFFYSFPAGATAWAAYEDLGYAPAIPVIRVHVSVVVEGGAANSGRAKPTTYGILAGSSRPQDGAWLRPSR
jgi:Bacterial Ig domain